MHTLSILLRITGILIALLLAGLGILYVLDLIPREKLVELAIRGGLAVGILAAASLVITLLVKKND